MIRRKVETLSLKSLGAVLQLPVSVQLEHAARGRGEEPLAADKWGQHFNGAAAEVMHSDRLGTKGRPGTFGEIKVG